tara:strand:- start:13138 stop:13458 length:321 start_codon:yes stop_codon:yes gene_type:complete
MKNGFTLIEVIVSLLIISVTFISFSSLIEQNLKSQEIKRLKNLQSQKNIDLLTIYTANPTVGDSEVLKLFVNSKVMTKNVGRIGTFQEIEIIVTTDKNKIIAKIIK